MYKSKEILNSFEDNQKIPGHVNYRSYRRKPRVFIPDVKKSPSTTQLLAENEIAKEIEYTAKKKRPLFR